MGPGSCPRHASTTTAGKHGQLFPAQPAPPETHPLGLCQAAPVVGSPLDLSPLVVPTKASLEQRAPLGSAKVAITASMCQGHSATKRVAFPLLEPQV